MNSINLSVLGDNDFRLAVAHEAAHCDHNDGAGLETLFDSVPKDRRDSALRVIFDVSVNRLSSVLLSFAMDRGLLGSPEFTDTLRIAMKLRDRFFSDPSPYMGSGHFELLKSLAGSLGLDFTVNTMDAVYSSYLEKGKSPLDDTDKIHGYTNNLKLAIDFCDPKTLGDMSVGNTAIRRFSRYGENAIANHSSIAAVEHLEVLSKLDFNDMAAMLDVTSADEIGRFHIITDQFLNAIFESLQSGIDVFDKLALRPALSYYPIFVIECMEALDDLALRRAVNHSFLDRYFNSDWLDLDDTNGFLLKDDKFIARLNELNSRIFSDPYMHSMMKDYVEGDVTISKLLAYKQFESAGYSLRLTNQRECNPLAGQLLSASRFPHLSGYVDKGKQLIGDLWTDTAQQMYGDFWALGNEIQNPDDLSEADITRASFFLMAGDYSSNVSLKIKATYPVFIGRDKPAVDQAAELFVRTANADDVVKVVKDVPGYLRGLVTKRLIHTDHLKSLSVEELSEQFGQDLGL